MHRSSVGLLVSHFPTRHSFDSHRLEKLTLKLRLGALHIPFSNQHLRCDQCPIALRPIPQPTPFYPNMHIPPNFSSSVPANLFQRPFFRPPFIFRGADYANNAVEICFSSTGDQLVENPSQNLHLENSIHN